MFCVTTKVGAFCGKNSIHVMPMSEPPLVQPVSIDLISNLPPENKTKPEELHTVCLDVGSNGELIVVTDSGRNVFLFEYMPVESKWKLKASWIMERRLIMVKICRRELSVFMIDKTGDVYVSWIGAVLTSPPKKVMGHPSMVMDIALTLNNLCITTCDRDEKIRISSCALAFQIKEYLLGHQSTVVSIALVCDDKNMLSSSSDGHLKLWKFGTKDPAGCTEMGSWNVLNTLNLDSKEVFRMRANDWNGNVYVAILITGYDNLSIFKLSPSHTKMELIFHGLDNDIVDLMWNGQALHIFCPEKGTLKKYTVLSDGMSVKETDVALKFQAPAMSDIVAFGALLRPRLTPPLKREQISRPDLTELHTEVFALTCLIAFQSLE